VQKDIMKRKIEYIKKFSYYQDLINPDLLVPIKKPFLNRSGSKKSVSLKLRNSIKNDNMHNRRNSNNKTIEDYLINIKPGKLKLRNFSKHSSTKKIIHRPNLNYFASASTATSIGNMNIDEKLLNHTLNKTLKQNQK
jgi:hypothetical protein